MFCAPVISNRIRSSNIRYSIKIPVLTGTPLPRHRGLRETKRDKTQVLQKQSRNASGLSLSLLRPLNAFISHSVAGISFTILLVKILLGQHQRNSEETTWFPFVIYFIISNTRSFVCFQPNFAKTI